MTQEELQKLLDSMSLEEKAGQMTQLIGECYLTDLDDEQKEALLTGPVRFLDLTSEEMRLAGSVLGIYGAKELKKIQKNYMEKHPHHIPLMFMLDVIHGMKTIFPAPIGQAAAFEPELARRCASAAAKEASSSGVHVTFAPMSDLVWDARWGRVMEATGEDPYLNSQYSQAMVKGFQGDDMSEPGRVSACVKHFAGYGGAFAGRDYNTVEVSEHTMREFYLPAYKAGIDAGAGMVMTSFNTIEGIPASINQRLMRDILRKEMNFDGVLISDYAALAETVAHGLSEDTRQAAELSLKAGVDIDMVSPVYSKNICSLVKEGVISEDLINEAAMRILQLKNKLGLFENPFKDADEAAEKELNLCAGHRKLATEAAEKSFVLLKNDGILPLNTDQSVAFIGPYINNKEIISSWAITGNPQDCVTIQEAAGKVFDSSRTFYAKGCPVLDSACELEGFQGNLPATLSPDEKERLFAEAVHTAQKAEIVVMALGEHYLQTGEAASRTRLEIPEIQMELFRKVKAVNDNIIIVLFNGRPLDLREISAGAKAILTVWLPGTEGGTAIINTLTGKSSPSGKLPMSFPYISSQVPVHYNEYSTGRPNAPHLKERYRSKYLDCPNEPLYPFGYGLSYTSFDISKTELSSSVLHAGEEITASVTVKNTGKVRGTETLQLYIQDISASVVRPVKELKGFQKISLDPEEASEVHFTITEKMLEFIRSDGTFGSETGKFNVWIGNNSQTQNIASFTFAL